MNRNHLALFCAVADAGSISGAAQRLRISQPAVSKQIAELEAQLGVQLLDRLPRGCRLTEAGRVLAGYGRRWMGIEADAARAIEEVRGLRRGRISVGASQTIGAYVIPKVLARFYREYPLVELDLRIANTEVIQRQLLDGGIEVGLTEGPLESDELASQVFLKDEMVLVVPPSHVLAERSRVVAKDLAAERFIFREEGSGTRAVVDRSLKAKGLAITPVLSLASPEAIKHAVIEGLGIAILSRLVVARELDRRELVAVAIADLKIQRPFQLQQVRGRAQSPALRQLLAMLAEIC